MARNPELYLYLAGSYAKTGPEDLRSYRFGGFGVRADGAVVKSRNGSAQGPVPEHHCEARLCRKLTPGSTVYVARVSRLGDWALARPCVNCERLMRNRGVTRCYYTIAPDEYGVMVF